MRSVKGRCGVDNAQVEEEEEEEKEDKEEKQIT